MSIMTRTQALGERARQLQVGHRARRGATAQVFAAPVVLLLLLLHTATRGDAFGIHTGAHACQHTINHATRISAVTPWSIHAGHCALHCDCSAHALQQTIALPAYNQLSSAVLLP